MKARYELVYVLRGSFRLLFGEYTLSGKGKKPGPAGVEGEKNYVDTAGDSAKPAS